MTEPILTECRICGTPLTKTQREGQGLCDEHERPTSHRRHHLLREDEWDGSWDNTIRGLEE